MLRDPRLCYMVVFLRRGDYRLRGAAASMPMTIQWLQDEFSAMTNRSRQAVGGILRGIEAKDISKSAIVQSR
jgi:hypothetical protein